MKNINLKILDELKNTIDDRKLFFLKGENEYAFTSDEMACYLKNNKDLNIYYIRYNNNEFQTAYYPIMDIITYIYKKDHFKYMSSEKFIRNCNVYSLHKELLYTYIDKGICERQENILLGEINYEETRFLEDIYNILTILSEKKKILIILDGLQYSNVGIIKFLIKLVNTKNNNLVIFSYFNGISHSSVHISNQLKRLINIADEKNIIINCPDQYQNSPINEISENNDSKLFEYYLNNHSVESLLNEIKNMIQMIALDDAKYYLDKIYEYISDNSKDINLNESSKFTIVEMIIIVTIYLNNANDLMQIRKKDFYYVSYLLESLKNFIPNENSIYFYKYNYLDCLVNHLQDKTEAAYKNYLNCKNYIANNPQKELSLKADTVYYLYLCYNKFLSTGRNDKLSNEEIELEAKLESQKFYNTLIYLYMYNYESDKDTIQKISNNELPFIYLEKAVNLARKIDNKLFLKLAYGRKATYFNSQKISNMLFKKDIAMQKEINLELENSKYSFMAYKYTMNEEYSLSHDTNNKLLIKIYNSLIKNEDRYNTDDSNTEIEFVIALYNMANNSMAAKDYISASSYLIIVIKGMKLLKIFNLNLFDLTKLQGMLAYCYYKMNMFFKCSALLNQMKQILSFVFNNENDLLNGTSLNARCDTLFYYYISNVLLELRDNDLESAKLNIKKADKFFLHQEGQWPLLFPIITEARFLLYYKLNMQEEAENQIKDCINFCIKNNLLIEKENMQNILKTHEFPSNLSNYFKLKCISKDNILTLLEQKKLQIEVDNYKKDMNFISIFSNNLNNIENDYNILLKSCMKIIGDYLLTKSILYITASDLDKVANGTIIYNNTDLNLNDSIINTIIQYFNSNAKSLILRKTERSFYTKNIFFDIWDKNDIITFIAIPIFKGKKIASIFIAYTKIDNQGITNDSLLDDSKVNTLQIVLNELAYEEKILHLATSKTAFM